MAHARGVFVGRRIRLTRPALPYSLLNLFLDARQNVRSDMVEPAQIGAKLNDL